MRSFGRINLIKSLMKYLLIALLFSGCINSTESVPTQGHNISGQWNDGGMSNWFFYQDGMKIHGVRHSDSGEGTDSTVFGGEIKGDSVFFWTQVYYGGHFAGYDAADFKGEIMQNDSIMKCVIYGSNVSVNSQNAPKQFNRR